MNTNNNKKTAIFFIVTSLSLMTALTFIIYSSSSSTTTVFAVQGEDKQKFTAQLSGDQQVPHIQTGKQGENGPPIIPLYKSDTPLQQMSGILTKGNITADISQGPMAGKQI